MHVLNQHCIEPGITQRARFTNSVRDQRLRRKMSTRRSWKRTHMHHADDAANVRVSPHLGRFDHALILRGSGGQLWCSCGTVGDAVGAKRVTAASTKRLAAAGARYPCSACLHLFILFRGSVNSSEHRGAHSAVFR